MYTPEGVLNEIRKHMTTEEREKPAQVEKVTPFQHVRLMDLSLQNRGKNNYFIKLFRRDVSEPLKTEYLLPQFVGKCCEEARMNGIKYYIRKDYNNYVTWRDSHFRWEFYNIYPDLD